MVHAWQPHASIPHLVPASPPLPPPPHAGEPYEPYPDALWIPLTKPHPLAAPASPLWPPLLAVLDMPLPEHAAAADSAMAKARQLVRRG